MVAAKWNNYPKPENMDSNKQSSQTNEAYVREGSIGGKIVKRHISSVWNLNHFDIAEYKPCRHIILFDLCFVAEIPRISLTLGEIFFCDFVIFGRIYLKSKKTKARNGLASPAQGSYWSL